MTPATWTCLADQLNLDGEALLFADAAQTPALAQRSQAAGYRVVEVDTAQVTDFRVAQARLAAALRLPATAGRNLDALADSLGDLARYWPDAPRIALFWKEPMNSPNARPPNACAPTDPRSCSLWKGNHR